MATIKTDASRGYSNNSLEDSAKELFKEFGVPYNVQAGIAADHKLSAIALVRLQHIALHEQEPSPRSWNWQPLPMLAFPPR